MPHIMKSLFDETINSLLFFFFFQFFWFDSLLFDIRTSFFGTLLDFFLIEL